MCAPGSKEFTVRLRWLSLALFFVWHILRACIGTVFELEYLRSGTIPPGAPSKWQSDSEVAQHNADLDTFVATVAAHDVADLPLLPADELEFLLSGAIPPGAPSKWRASTEVLQEMEALDDYVEALAAHDLAGQPIYAAAAFDLFSPNASLAAAGWEDWDIFQCLFCRL